MGFPSATSRLAKKARHLLSCIGSHRRLVEARAFLGRTMCKKSHGAIVMQDAVCCVLKAVNSVLQNFKILYDVT
jgi:hypothetical protein